VSTKTPIAIETAPASASGVGRSPKMRIAAIVASTGPVPRASGYTTDRSPARYPRCRKMKYATFSAADPSIHKSSSGPIRGPVRISTAIATGA